MENIKDLENQKEHLPQLKADITILKNLLSKQPNLSHHQIPVSSPPAFQDSPLHTQSSLFTQPFLSTKETDLNELNLIQFPSISKILNTIPPISYFPFENKIFLSDPQKNLLQVQQSQEENNNPSLLTHVENKLNFNNFETKTVDSMIKISQEEDKLIQTDSSVIDMKHFDLLIKELYYLRESKAVVEQKCLQFQQQIEQQQREHAREIALLKISMFNSVIETQNSSPQNSISRSSPQNSNLIELGHSQKPNQIIDNPSFSYHLNYFNSSTNKNNNDIDSLKQLNEFQDKDIRMLQSQNRTLQKEVLRFSTGQNNQTNNLDEKTLENLFDSDLASDDSNELDDDGYGDIDSKQIRKHKQEILSQMSMSEKLYGNIMFLKNKNKQLKEALHQWKQQYWIMEKSSRNNLLPTNASTPTQRITIPTANPSSNQSNQKSLEKFIIPKQAEDSKLDSGRSQGLLSERTRQTTSQQENQQRYFSKSRYKNEKLDTQIKEKFGTIINRIHDPFYCVKSEQRLGLTSQSLRITNSLQNPPINNKSALFFQQDFTTSSPTNLSSNLIEDRLKPPGISTSIRGLGNTGKIRITNFRSSLQNLPSKSVDKRSQILSQDKPETKINLESAEKTRLFYLKTSPKENMLVSKHLKSPQQKNSQGKKSLVYQERPNIFDSSLIQKKFSLRMKDKYS